MDKPIEINDLNAAAFLSLQNIQVTLTTRQGRVFFLVPGDDVSRRELARLQGNPMVPALDLISHQKRLRGKMLDARNEGNTPNDHGQGDSHANGNRKTL